MLSQPQSYCCLAWEKVRKEKASPPGIPRARRLDTWLGGLCSFPLPHGQVVLMHGGPDAWWSRLLGGTPVRPYSCGPPDVFRGAGNLCAMKLEVKSQPGYILESC